MKLYVLSLVLILCGCASTQTQKPSDSTNSKVTPTPVVQQAQPVVGRKKNMPVGEQKLSCANVKETRTLEVVKKDNGCSLNYVKSGKMSEVASSAHGSQHCEKTKEKIRAKLEMAGYHCTT